MLDQGTSSLAAPAQVGSPLPGGVTPGTRSISGIDLMRQQAELGACLVLRPLARKGSLRTAEAARQGAAPGTGREELQPAWPTAMGCVCMLQATAEGQELTSKMVSSQKVRPEAASVSRQLLLGEGRKGSEERAVAILLACPPEQAAHSGGPFLGE